MKKKRKRKSIKKNNCTIKKTTKESKKILDGVDLANSYKDFKTKKTSKKEENKINLNLNDHVQTFVSILFTIVIIVALILLIIVLYNNYLKKEDSKCNELEVCQNYIKKDYGIKEEEVGNFVKNLRGIIYNIDEFNSEEITNLDLINFATYLVWGSDSEYLLCDISIDSNCLVTKKEMEYIELENSLKKYLNLKDIQIDFSKDYETNDKTRIYLNDSKVILTFKEFEYETLRHDIVDISIDEDMVKVIFALSKRIENTEIYSYVGSKTLELKYLDGRFIFKKINTKLH